MKIGFGKIAMTCKSCCFAQSNLKINITGRELACHSSHVPCLRHCIASIKLERLSQIYIVLKNE